MGATELWEMAEQQLIKALEAQNVDWTLKEGDGAFYGPKIDIQIKDALGRSI
jgi:threonyl-tRNA synthetase